MADKLQFDRQQLHQIVLRNDPDQLPAAHDEKVTAPGVRHLGYGRKRPRIGRDGVFWRASHRHPGNQSFRPEAAIKLGDLPRADAAEQQAVAGDRKFPVR